MSDESIETGIGRRDFARVTLGALGTAALAGPSAHTAAPPPRPGVKLCVQSPAIPSDEQLLFLKQLGAEYVSVASTPELRTADGFMQIKKRYADAGITVYGASRRHLRRHRHPRSQSDDGRRKLSADRVRIRLHEGPVESGERGGLS